MTTISMELVKTLRDKTQVGMMDCKKALEEANGDLDRAIEILRKKGAAVAAKRAENETTKGRVESNVSADFKKGSLVEVACETDFSANTDTMKNFVELVAAQATNSGETSIDALLAQTIANKGALTVKDALEELISKICESIKISRVAHFSVAGHGLVNAYIHPGSTIGILVELKTESDLSSNLDELKALAKDICMQIAVTNPLCVEPSELDTAVVEKERAFAKEQLVASNKPESIHEKIIEGKLSKFYEDVCLSRQLFIKNDKLSISQHLQEMSKKLGSPISIVRFARFAIGR